MDLFTTSDIDNIAFIDINFLLQIYRSNVQLFTLTMLYIYTY